MKLAEKGGPILKDKQVHSSRFTGWFSKQLSIPRTLLMLGMSVQATFFTLYLTQKYDDYRTGYFDFGSAVQTAWMAANGHFNVLALGRPITLIASFFFWIFPHPQTLIVFQCTCIAIGAIPLFLLARKVLSNDWYAAVIGCVYLAYPALWGVNQYEYHDLALSIPFLLFSVYFYTVKGIVPFSFFLALSLFTSPYIVVVAIAFTLSMFIDNYERTRGLRPVIFPLITISAAILFAIYLQTIPPVFSYQFATLGASTYSLTGSTAYVNPGAVLSQPFSSLLYAAPLKLAYLAAILTPVIFLPFLALRKLLPAIPWFGVVIFYTPALGAGGVGPVYTYSQWSSFLIPFVFVGTIYGFKKVLSSKNFLKQNILRPGHLLAFMVITSLIVAAISSGLSPLGRQMTLSTGDNTVPTDFNSTSIFHGIWPTPVENTTTLDWFMSQVPQNYSLLTQNQIGSKAWARLAPIYIFYQPGFKNVNADAILVDTHLEGLCSTCLATIISSGSYVTYLSDPDAGITLYFIVR